MYKTRIACSVILLTTLLGLVGCSSEAITTTVKSTVTLSPQMTTVTNTVTGMAQTVTVTATQSVVITKTVTPTATPTTTTRTSTSTSTSTSATTTSTTTEFTPVTSPDGKLQITTAVIVGAGTGMDASSIGLRGKITNLSTETLNGRITVEFLGESGVLGTYTADVLNIAPGVEKNFLVETDLNRVTPTGFNVSVVVIP